MVDRTHWGECWKIHHECAVAMVDRLALVLLKTACTCGSSDPDPAAHDPIQCPYRKAVDTASGCDTMSPR